MIYLDHGATSFPKPSQVHFAMADALRTCANPGRGGHRPAMLAAAKILSCREQAAALFDCQPEQVAFTSSCTHGLNIAIQTLVKPGTRVVISGFEHNAVVRPLYHLGAKITVAGRKLFDRADTLSHFEDALKQGADVAIITHVSNVFGYILPVEELCVLCHRYGTAVIIDAAQSAGILPLSLAKTGVAFIAMPGHKGLLGPQGTGILLCNHQPDPLLFGGTGSLSAQMEMPDFLPDRLEAGTLNVPGIAGLGAGIAYVARRGTEAILRREQTQARACVLGLEKLGYTVFHGKDQIGTVSFLPKTDCETFAQQLSCQNIALRAGLHCAPLAHQSAGTFSTGTVRISFGHDASPEQTKTLLKTLSNRQKNCE